MSNPVNRHALLPRYRRLMTAAQWKKLSSGFMLGTIAGVSTGLALLALLPA